MIDARGNLGLGRHTMDSRLSLDSADDEPEHVSVAFRASNDGPDPCMCTKNGVSGGINTTRIGCQRGWCYVVEPSECDLADRVKAEQLPNGERHAFVGAGKRACDSATALGNSEMRRRMQHETDRFDAMRIRGGWHSTHGTLYGAQRLSVEARTQFNWCESAKLNMPFFLGFS